MRPRPLPLVAPRVEGLHGDLKVASDSVGVAKRRVRIVALPASSPALPTIVATSVDPSSDAFGASA
jgi:hypothetical protein